MFDWIRNLGKSPEERLQAQISAFLDDDMSSAARTQFERQMAQDPVLKQDVLQQQMVQRTLRTLPPIRAPRNFTLTSQMVEKPATSSVRRSQPVLQLAITVAALILIAFGTYNLSGVGLPRASSVAMESAPEPTAAVASNFAAAEAVEREVPRPAVEAETSVVEMQEEVVAPAEAAVEEAPALAQATGAEGTAEDETRQALAGVVQTEAETPPVNDQTGVEPEAAIGGEAAGDVVGTPENGIPLLVTLSTSEVAAAPSPAATALAPRPQPTNTPAARLLPTQAPVDSTLGLSDQANSSTKMAATDRTTGIAAIAAGVLALVVSGWLWWRRR